ncbi:DB module family protein [Acanthocheilonema viteae]
MLFPKSDAMISVWIIHFIVFAYFEYGVGKFRSRCDIMHYIHCCNPLIYNKCFEKCHYWAARNCFRDRAQHEQVITDWVDVSAIKRKNDRNEECGTVNAEFTPCVQKEIADQIFYDCCKLYVEPECHELCRYEANHEVAQSLLLETFRKKKCPVNNIPAILYCASQNRDNRLCCRQFGLISTKFGTTRRCLRMCDPYRFDIPILQEYDFVCLNNWDIIMYCHHGGLRY